MNPVDWVGGGRSAPAGDDMGCTCSGGNEADGGWEGTHSGCVEGNGIAYGDADGGGGVRCYCYCCRVAPCS